MKTYSFRNQELNQNREIRSNLIKIWGVGWLRATQITSKLGIGYPIPTYKLNNYRLDRINSFLNIALASQTRAEREEKINIRRLIEIKSYHGIRHKLGLPVRGQRSKSNGRTMKRKKIKNRNN